jgi:hypothetical protein
MGELRGLFSVTFERSSFRALQCIEPMLEGSLERDVDDSPSDGLPIEPTRK